MPRITRRLVGLVGATALVVVPTTLPSQSAVAADAPTRSAATVAAEPSTVASAITRQDGSSQSVRGYVVGQPTATSTVVRSGYPSDYAIAIADTAGETSTDKMLYVQVPSALRSTWGLKSNPSLLGRRVDVTGALKAYFSHAGMTGTTAIAAAGSTTPTDPPPTDPQPGDPGTYYAGTEGLTGAQLEAKLHSIIRDQRVLSYSQVWEGLKDTDEDPNNTANVRLLYKGTSSSKSNNGGGADNWNREHVWAKSHGDFGTANGPGTDLHHLRPTDVTVNSARGNLDFDNGGTQSSEAPGNYADGDSWEPRDAVKGDVARMILYMSVRYEGGDGFPDLEVNDSVGNGSRPNIGRVSVLKQWSQEDPPDAFEKRRNERIFENWQGNRNPFIDHPEWVESIW